MRQMLARLRSPKVIHVFFTDGSGHNLIVRLDIFFILSVLQVLLSKSLSTPTPFQHKYCTNPPAPPIFCLLAACNTFLYTCTFSVSRYPARNYFLLNSLQLFSPTHQTQQSIRSSSPHDLYILSIDCSKKRS